MTAAIPDLVLPPDRVADRYSMLAGCMLAKTAEDDRESRTLAATRDSLLPKLISGELRIRDAECIAGAVA